MKRRAHQNRHVYPVIAGLNIGFALMFTVLLWPAPPVAEVRFVSEVPRAPAAVVSREATVGIPVRVVVPSIGIDILVRPGSYNPHDQTWTLDESSAFHADQSVPPNDNNGTTLIYGHAWASIFGRLPEVSSGAEALVYAEDGAVFRYRFASSRQVVPSDTSVLTVEGPPVLVLQTCSGPLDAYRTLVSFDFEKVDQV